jgi:hypothetical protein
MAPGTNRFLTLAYEKKSAINRTPETEEHISFVFCLMHSFHIRQVIEFRRNQSSHFCTAVSSPRSGTRVFISKMSSSLFGLFTNESLTLRLYGCLRSNISNQYPSRFHCVASVSSMNEEDNDQERVSDSIKNDGRPIQDGPKDRKCTRVDGDETSSEDGQQRSLEKIWETVISKDQQNFSDFERSEAIQDLRGKNLLAAVAPQTLLQMGLEALDRELEQQIRWYTPSLQTALTTSPMYNDREFRIKFVRANRMSASKAATRLLSYLSYALELFGQELLMRPIRISVLSATDEQALRIGWMQLLLTRDQIERRIIVMDDLGPTNVPLQCRVRVWCRYGLSSTTTGTVLTIKPFNLHDADESRFFASSSSFSR